MTQSILNWNVFHFLQNKQEALPDLARPSWVQTLEPAAVRLLSFGQLPIVIDWILIEALVHVGQRSGVSGGHSALYDALKLIIELDPLYYDVYQIAGDFLTVLERDGSGAKELLLKGRQFIQEKLSDLPDSVRQVYWKNPWKIYILLAYTDLFLLKDMHAAAFDFQEAASIPGSPGYLLALVSRFQQGGGAYLVGIRLVQFLISTEKNPQVIQQLERNQKDLMVAYYIYDIRNTFLAFLKSQSVYHRSQSLSVESLMRLFKKFLKKNKISIIDPWGGQLSLDLQGKIITTTPYESVFGLK